MPLGQAPYGSRPEPDPKDSPPPGNSIRGGPFARFGWVLWVGIAVLAAVSFFNIGRPDKKAAVGDTTQCLTTKVCGEGWRCYAEPKDDPFAVMGVCSHTCEDTLQCPVHFRCVEVAQTKEQVVPVGSRGSEGATREKVCRPCGGACEP